MDKKKRKERKVVHISAKSPIVDVFLKNGKFWLRVQQSWGYGVVGVVSYFTPYLAQWILSFPWSCLDWLLKTTYQCVNVCTGYRKEKKIWDQSKDVRISIHTYMEDIYALDYSVQGRGASKSQDPWLLDDLLRVHNSAATLTTRNKDTERVDIWYWVLWTIVCTPE